MKPGELYGAKRAAIRLPVRPRRRDNNTQGGKAMTEQPTNWMDLANCRGLPPSMFVFDETRGSMTTGMRRQIAQAKQICGECPVTQECLTYGITHNLKGVWGGRTGRERRAMMPRRGDVPYDPQARCGTNAGFTAHHRHGTEPCHACREARRAYDRDNWLAS